MNRRPPSITIIGWLFIVVGIAGLVWGLLPTLEAAAAGRPIEFRVAEEGIASLSRILAVVGGVGLFFRFNWARWLLVVWMVFHVWVAAVHSLSELVMHVVVFTTVIVFLFRPQVAGYFLTPKEP